VTTVSNFYVHGAAAMTSNDDTWSTPRDKFDEWNQEFNFTLDAAAMQKSALCSQWFGPDHEDPQRRDALVMDWFKEAGGGTVWLNPPYGRSINKWVKKADTESKRGAIVVCLVPSRTDTHWFHNYCISHEVRYLRGRLKFGGVKTSAPFPSALVVMRGSS
jgi:phage N-6-adenine-methyltransferase